ncbi:DEAD/DEAH box helicase [Archangium gephyra]|nr:DEAD/DEAH box helicase [Archangium gephyra]
MRQRFVSEFLGFLEKREERLLSWGFYDATFEPDAVEAALQEEGGEALVAAWESFRRGEGHSMADLLSDMAYERLLHEVSPGRYRTRFAETVRLMARLRQLFRPKDWATGPGLVSDIKMHLTPRLYPRRDQSVEECWREMAPHCSRPELQRDLFLALAAGSKGKPVYFSGFQKRAFAHLLQRYGEQGLSGSVVSAGTGAGKTKAFYVPAFLSVAADVAARPARFPRVVAIYPRNVLLADQLREALSEVAKLRPVLERHRVRPLTVGALLGDTPWEEDLIAVQRPPDTEAYSNWKRLERGWRVPFVQSPLALDEPLIWRDEDRTAGSTALYRQGRTVPDVPDGTLLITREQIQREPPDILFLSLEMLHREMGNPEWWRAFGIQGHGDETPRLLLLDEVHTYNGLPGAQAAWVLRRWFHWMHASRIHVVGLSATLREASLHLALVSGLSRQNVQEFAPYPNEFESEGMEYNLALKGDPASAASLLATSIQTGMLLARAQTPRQASRSRGEDSVSSDVFYARRVFGFSDNLDTLNRWMADMADAERQRLALLRLHPAHRTPPESVDPDTLRRMEQAGQIWELPRELGYDLNQSLRVTRCSSQDPGVDAASDIIVATSSLEVGYDDPEVAATLHHKRPRSLSSFIQRKGRAGRRRGTRPWSVLVLSDYGSDRWAFQHADQYFQPCVDFQFLPVTNPYVLRIQATAFLVDWIGRVIHQGSSYLYLGRRGQWLRAVQTKAIQLLQDLLEMGPQWRRFRRELARAFHFPRGRGNEPLDEAALDAILWEEPRPLLKRVVPTLLRKLEADWSLARDPNAVEDQGLKRPLPEFLPPATFAELEVAESQLWFPRQKGDPPKREESLSLARALFEVCPGHVSKRYATGARERGYWHSLSPKLLEGLESAPIHEAFPEAIFMGSEDGFQVYQIQRVALTQAPENVKETSRATWRWRSRLRPVGRGQRVPVLLDEPWSSLVTSCEAHLHRDGSSIELLRYTHQADFEILRRREDPLQGTFVLQKSEEGSVVPQAVGFRQRVDGIVFRLEGPRLRELGEWDESSLARLRPDYLLHLFEQELGLNIFLAEWLSQTAVGSLAATARTQRCSLPEAQQRLRGLREKAAERVLDSMFHVRESSASDDPEEGRLKARVMALWRDAERVRRIEELERCLWEAPTEAFRTWARQRAVAAIAQALRVAAVRAVPDVSEDDLEVDVTWREDGTAEVHLTELHSGGLGQMEQVVQAMRREPEFFHEALRHALSFCERDEQSRRLLQANEASTREPRVLEGAFQAVREARDFAEMEAARDELRRELARSGLPPTRATTVSVMSRLLRPASSPRTDAAMFLLNRVWRRTNHRLGIAVDPRVFSYLCIRLPSGSRRLGSLFQELGEGQVPQASQMHALAQQLLFPGCEDSCRECLDQPNRYNPFGRPSRALARRMLGWVVPEIDVDAEPEHWLASVRRGLRAGAHVQVVVQVEGGPRVAAGVQALLAEEVEIGHLLLPIVLSRVERTAVRWRFTLQLKEAVHGQS